MIQVTIPGFGDLDLHHLVLDYNGTLAVDGRPLDGVTERLTLLSRDLSIHVITADTFGTVEKNLGHLPLKVAVLGKDHQDQAKLAYVNHLGSEITACIANGRNDRLMLQACALGMAVILNEGACSQTLQSAKLVFTRITDALDVLTHPLRLVAGLRT